jgi:transposase InsO family protein
LVVPGWLKDLYSGEIVGYTMGERMTRHLVMQALFRAVSLRRPAPGLIQHTDKGSQYCLQEYRALVAQFGMQASMSRRGNCYDNAPIESFWGRLKNELIHHRRYTTREQARDEISTLTRFTIASGGRHGLVTYRQRHSRSDTVNGTRLNIVLAYTNSG